METHEAPARVATLYRMVMPGHVCPYGLEARALLERQGCRIAMGESMGAVALATA